MAEIYAMTTEYDASYKMLFSAPEMVRDLVMGFIPDDWLQGLDYSTLEKLPGSYVSDDFRHPADDVVWRVKVDDHWMDVLVYPYRISKQYRSFHGSQNDGLCRIAVSRFDSTGRSASQ